MHNQPERHVAVVLSGCGHLDGSEITEAVSTLIALSELGAKYQCFAPEINNAIEMAKRIARGDVKPLHQLQPKDFDGLVFPGGFGAAQVLSNFASKGSMGSLNPEVKRVILEFHRESKPIGAICISPTLIALALGAQGVTLTIGNDVETANEIIKTGAHHVTCPVTDYVSDRDHKVLTTPAYMYDAKPFEVYTGIRKMIRELVEMA